MLIHFVFIRDTDVMFVYLKMQYHNTVYIQLLNTYKNWQRPIVENDSNK
jgi:hypothetical protein